MLLRSFAGFVLGLALAVSAFGERPYAFAETPGKLSKKVVPRHYVVRLQPDAEALQTPGEVTVELEVLEPTTRLEFNAVGTTFGTPRVDGQTVGAVQTDAERQTATIPLASPLSRGRHTLVLPFRSTIGQQATGLYREKYTVNGQPRQLLGSQMEPADARRMFPCWDEPAFRATFQLIVTAPTGLAVISNTDPQSDRPAGPGFHEVTFAPTPPMATYLVVLCIGEFEALTDEVDGVRLRVWATGGKAELGRYALESTQRIVRYYNDYFGVKYPLAKLDHIAIPGGFVGAMENWGAITYNESGLLFDPRNSAQSTKERVFAMLAHEIAHQWFGNLVTMAWWDNLWLNEGFASWMGTKCTAALNPEWRFWLKGNAEIEGALALDATHGTHPIQQRVETESQAQDAFDAITYIKGQAFIRMLENYLGEADFRAGIRRYMAKHALGNTTTADLWAALEKASRKPVSRFARTWTESPGFPFLQVHTRERGGRLELALEQARFLFDGSASPTRWKVPVSFAPLEDPARVQNVLLTERRRRLSTALPANTAVKVNSGHTGFYRAVYSPELVKAQVASFRRLPEADRLNLLSDAWGMAVAGHGPLTDYLAFVETLGPEETCFAVWDLVLSHLDLLANLERRTPGEAAFVTWATARLRPVFARLGWDPRPIDSNDDTALRVRLLTALGGLGDAEIVAEARRRWGAFLQDPATLPADLRTPVCGIVGLHASAAEWETFHRLALRAENVEERLRYQEALQLARDPELARRTLALALTEDRPFAEWFPLVPGVAGQHPDLAWTFARENLDALFAHIPEGGAFTTRTTFLPAIARAASDAGRADELVALVSARLGASGAAEAAKVVEEIRIKAAFKTREIPRLDAALRGAAVLARSRKDAK